MQLTWCAVMEKSDPTGHGSVGSNSIPLTFLNRPCELDRRRRNRTEQVSNTGPAVWSRSISKAHLRGRVGPRVTRIKMDYPDEINVVFSHIGNRERTGAGAEQTDRHRREHCVGW